jgi:hypothetical protein
LVKASSARVVLFPIRPSISPGEKPARSSITCVCTTFMSTAGLAAAAFAAGFCAGPCFCADSAGDAPAQIERHKTQETKRSGENLFQAPELLNSCEERLVNFI